MASRNPIVPSTPRVISPSPTPSDPRSQSQEPKDSYFGPVTRSSASKQPPIREQPDAQPEDDDSFELGRARTRSRSPIVSGSSRRRMSGLTSVKAKSPESSSSSVPLSGKKSSTASDSVSPNGTERSGKGHLSPSSANGSTASYWRDLSRSPSPLGLIPIHRHWRSLIHRHEIPRKVLHVSIGVFTLYLYTSGVQPSTITPALLGALIPISSVDYLRHRFPGLNRIYVRVCGALMRESEVNGWNGVVWYLLGAYIALRCFPKDVGVMSVLLLSWCDTAASTVGRAYGRYTPRIRRGKSLAGSLAAFLVGVGTAVAFWGWLTPREDVNNRFLYQRKGGAWSLGLVSVFTGLIAAASEVVDIVGIDDNLTIPVISAGGIYGFLRLIQ